MAVPIKNVPICLDLTNKTVILKPDFYMQSINTAVLDFNLTDAFEPVDLTGTTIEIDYKGVDNGIEAMSTTLDPIPLINITNAVNGEFQLIIASYVLSVKGKVAVQVKLIGNDRQSVFPEFYILVKESINLDDAIVATNEFPVLMGAINEVNDAIRAVQDIATNEVARIAAENIREENELNRIQEENNRVSAETSRTNAETVRASAETTRQGNETIRQSNETARVTAESNRVTEFNTIKSEYQTAIDNSTLMGVGDISKIPETNTVDAILNDRASIESISQTANNSSVLLNNVVTTANNTNIKNDGSADASTLIQQLIDSLESKGGGTLLIPQGTYRLDNYLKLPKNVKIIGIGDVTLEKGVSTLNALMVTKDYQVNGYNGTCNAEINNIIFNGRKDLWTTPTTLLGIGHAKNITIQNCTFKNLADWHMLEINGSQYVYVDKCVFDDYGTYDGTNFTGSEMLQLDFMNRNEVFPWYTTNFDNTANDHVYITKCEFKNHPSSAVTNGVFLKCIGHHTFASGITQNNIFINYNKFYNVSQPICLYDMYNLQIDDNEFDTVYYAINVDCNMNDTIKVQIKGNKFHNMLTNNPNTRAIIICNDNTPTTVVYYAKSINIENNYMDDVGRHGIGINSAKQCLIQGNHVFACGYNGIYAYGGNDIKIIGNDVQYSGRLDNTKADIVIGGQTTINANNTFVEANHTSKDVADSGANSKIINNCVSGVWK